MMTNPVNSASRGGGSATQTSTPSYTNAFQQQAGQQQTRPALNRQRPYATREQIALAAYRQAELRAMAVIQRAGGDPNNTAHMVAYMDAVNPFDKQESPSDHIWSDGDIVDALRKQFAPEPPPAPYSPPAAGNPSGEAYAPGSPAPASSAPTSPSPSTEAFATEPAALSRPSTPPAQERMVPVTLVTGPAPLMPTRPASPTPQLFGADLVDEDDDDNLAAEPSGGGTTVKGRVSQQSTIDAAAVQRSLAVQCNHWSNERKIMPDALEVDFFRTADPEFLHEKPLHNREAMCRTFFENRTVDGRYAYSVKTNVRWPEPKNRKSSALPGLFTIADLKMLKQRRKMIDRQKPRPIAPVGRNLVTGDLVPELWDRKTTPVRPIPVLAQDDKGKKTVAKDDFRANLLTPEQQARRLALLTGKAMNESDPSLVTFEMPVKMKDKPLTMEQQQGRFDKLRRTTEENAAAAAAEREVAVTQGAAQEQEIP